MSEQKAYGTKDSHALIRNIKMPGRNSKDPAAWLKQLDINSHDFPYISVMITDSFHEWTEKGAGLAFAGAWDWCVFSFEGKWLAGKEEADGPNHPLWEQVVNVSLTSARDCMLQIEENGSETAYLAMPLKTRSSGEIYALLGCKMPAGDMLKGGRYAAEAMSLHYITCFYRQLEHLFVEDLTAVHNHAERESGRRSLLFQIVQRMHDNIDVDAVLTEVIESIAAMYPGAKLTLYMSQDYHTSLPQVMPVPLKWDTEDVREKAFKDGRVAMKAHDDGQPIVEIGLPLGGKQGVYGVFHLVMHNPEDPDTDLSFLSMVAGTAGTAFENAKLYERSNQLIRELRMSNELTQRLNQSLQLGETFEVAFEELLEMFEADYCCILHYNEEKQGLEAVACNHPALIGEIIDVGRGVGGRVYSTGEPVIVSGYPDQSGTRSKLMDFTESQSLIATPISVGGEARGVIMLTHREPRFFSYDHFKLLQSLAGHIGLAVGNALLHAEVHRLANRDSLTGLYARHFLDQSIKEKQSGDYCGTLVVVDIDYFKQVNDTYGHQKGDLILRQVSDIVRLSIRQGDLAARWGGEELAIYLPQLSAEQAFHVAERIRIRVQKETDPVVTVSCGIAEWNWTDQHLTSVDSLFYRADMALYEAKNNGRNQVVVDKGTEEKAGQQG
ncbi:Phytochrome-like protein cph2 [compost metagenome]